jgi:ATP-dependent DNA ligase
VKGTPKGKGQPLFEKLEQLNLEGMVMKLKDSVYSFSSRLIDEVA